MGTYLNSITPYTLYKSECLSAYFVDKTLMLFLAVRGNAGGTKCGTETV